MLFSKKNLHITIDQTGIDIQVVQTENGWTQPTLVFLHHALGSVRQWKGFPEDLAQKTGLSAFAYNRQGHGGSDEPGIPRDIDYLHIEAFERLPHLLQTLNIQQPLLIGHSDGATIALLYASRFPCAGVIAEAPHILVEPHTLEGIREALREKESLIRGLEKYHGAKAAALVDAWAGTWLAPWFYTWNIQPALAAISCPVLVMQGTKDPYGTMVHTEGILKALPKKACSFMVKDGGHFLHIEAREATLERMATFIRNSISQHTIPSL